jgi:hypothetical protein
MGKNSARENKEKILKINSTHISPKKKDINNKYNSKPQSKDGKNSNHKNIDINTKKYINKNDNKKEIIIPNDDDNKNKSKNILTEYDNNSKTVKKTNNINCISDINEISIEGIKQIHEVNNTGIEIKKEKEIKREAKSDINSFQSLTIENKIKNIKSKEITIIKKKKINLKDIISTNINKNKNSIEIKDNNNNNFAEEKETEVEKEKEKEKYYYETKSQEILIPKIHKKDEDPQEAKEYIFDIIESLLIEEDYYLNKKKYINPHYLENENSELTPEMRTVAVDWLVLIHHKIFKFKENTLFLTIQIFDRYLSKKDLNTEKTELLLLTSFMLASKHNEIDYVNMQETLQLAQNKFTKEQVIEMESEILSKLDFELLSPTMCEYFTLYASYLNLSEEKINHGFYVLDIVLVDFHMLEYSNFMLALAVVQLITKK